MNSLRQKLEVLGRQLSTSEQICRDLRSRESDLQEMLSSKETQLDVLRMRLDEADRLLELEKQRIVDVQTERDRLVPRHLSSHFSWFFIIYVTHYQPRLLCVCVCVILCLSVCLCLCLQKL